MTASGTDIGTIMRFGNRVRLSGIESKPGPIELDRNRERIDKSSQQ